MVGLLILAWPPSRARTEDVPFFRPTVHRTRCATRFDPFMEPLENPEPPAGSSTAPAAWDGSPAAPSTGAALDATDPAATPAVVGTAQEPEPLLSGRYPGVDVSSIVEPDDTLHRGHAADPMDFLRADPLGLEIDCAHRPEYLPPQEYIPVLDMRPRAPSRRNQAIHDLIEKELYRQARRLLKRQWRRQFEDDLSMGYDFYEARLTEINQIGKDPDDFDPSNADYYNNETRDSALGRTGREGEKELTLIEWGPFKVDDEGSFSFDIRSFFHLDPDGVGSLLFGDDSGPERRGRRVKALVSDKHYRVSTKLKLNFDPLRGLRNSDYQDTITSYGGVLDIDFLSDVLNRELFTTEFEAELDRDGKWGVFFSIVLHGRR